MAWNLVELCGEQCLKEHYKIYSLNPVWQILMFGSNPHLNLMGNIIMSTFFVYIDNILMISLHSEQNGYIDGQFYHLKDNSVAKLLV